MDKMQFKNYGLEEIQKSELLSINGGSEASYNVGYAVGSAVRTVVDATGRAVSWMNDILFGKVFDF